MTTCTICEGDFDLDTEGGVQGYLGILPVAFCPTCHAGIMDFAEQMYMHSEERLRDYLVDYFNDNGKVCIKHDEEVLIKAINALLEAAEPCDD